MWRWAQTNENTLHSDTVLGIWADGPASVPALSCLSPSLHTSLCLSVTSHTFICLYDNTSQTYTEHKTTPKLTPCFIVVVIYFLFYCKCWMGRARICQKCFRWIRARHTETFWPMRERERVKLVEGFSWTPLSSKHSFTCCSTTVTGGSVSVCQRWEDSVFWLVKRQRPAVRIMPENKTNITVNRTEKGFTAGWRSFCNVCNGFSFS